ncbi:MAG: LAGLIDADG family homing endonuclease [Candidatus Nanoarchaeia archaeon]
MQINDDLASIHAYLCADGYVIKSKNEKYKYFHIGLRNTNSVLLKDFQNKFNKCFKLKPHICEGRCRIGSKEIYNLLTEEFGSFYSDSWRMPKLNETNLKSWLRSYFDCEGWVRNHKRQNRHIGADCINKKGLIQVKEGLNKLGINSKFKKRNTRDIYHLAIYGKENLIKFQKEINFLHPDKKEKLQLAINSYMDYVWKDNFKEIFKEKAKLKKGSNVIRLCSILKPNLERMSKFLKTYKINSKIYEMKNGFGKIYYELAIYGKENINKLQALNLINNGYKTKKGVGI